MVIRGPIETRSTDNSCVNENSPAVKMPSYFQGHLPGHGTEVTVMRPILMQCGKPVDLKLLHYFFLFTRVRLSYIADFQKRPVHTL